MNEQTKTIEIEGFGPVTFRPLGKVAMQRLREAARRGGFRGYGSSEAVLRRLPTNEAQRMREDALLVSRAVTEPSYATDEELQAAFEGREEFMLKIASEIRAASWPNRGAS